MLSHGREWSPEWRVGLHVYSCVGIHQQCLTRAGWRLAQRRRSVNPTTPADVTSDGNEGGECVLSRLGGPQPLKLHRVTDYFGKYTILMTAG